MTRLSLPQRGVYAAIIEQLPPPLSRSVVHAIRRQLRADLAPLRDLLPPGEELELPRYAHDRTLACPASPAFTPFGGWRPATAARRLGAEALARWAGDRGRSPADALDETIERLIKTDARLGGWLGGIDPAALGVTRARAASWLSRALALVPWTALDRVEVHAAGQFAVVAPLIKLQGRPDLSVLVGTPDAPATVLVALGAPSPATVRLDLLAMAVPTGRAPLRAVTVDPASGSVSATDVTETVLRAGASEAVVAARTLTEARAGRPGAPAPGPHCWRCPHLPGCGPGEAWRAVAQTRSAGIPLPDPAPGPRLQHPTG